MNEMSRAFGMAQVGEMEDSPSLEDVLLAFGGELVGMRKEAINGRKEAGIDEVWQEDEDAYEGTDNATRGGETAKGRTMESPMVHGRRGGLSEDGVRNTRSRAFVNISRPYTDAAAARVADMLLPTDELPFAVETSAKTDAQTFLELLARQDPTGQSMGPGGEPGGDLAGMFATDEAEAKKSAEAANLQIKDWMQETKWHGAGREVIEWSAKLGTGILKGPFPVKRRFPESIGGFLEGLPIEMRTSLLYRPGSESTNPWHFYPDPSCGNNIQNGAYVWEKVPTSARRLRELKRDGNYIGEAIEACLEEGPKDEEGKKDRNSLGKGKSKSFELWLFVGQVPRRLVESEAGELGAFAQDGFGGLGSLENGPEDEAKVFGQVVVCNGRIVKVAENPTEIEEFPYDVLNWQKRSDSWAGIGVARQLETPQRGLNAAVRNMLDNAALSAGPMIVYFEDVITPANGRWEISARKLWKALVPNTLESVQQVRNAFVTIDIPSRQAELMEIIQFFLRMAEESTGLPLLLQGQSGSGTPDTVGGMQLMTNAATTVLRRLARNFDDGVTEPHITRYYAWIKEFGPAAARGDLMVRARGSSVLVERELQTQALVQLMATAKDPVYKLSPERMARTYVESQRFDYDSIKMSDEEYQQMIASQQQPDIRQVVAEIKGEVTKAVEELRAKVKTYEVDTEAAVDREKIAAEAKHKELEVGAREDEAKREGEAGLADETLATIGLGPALDDEGAASVSQTPAA